MGVDSTGNDEAPQHANQPPAREPAAGAGILNLPGSSTGKWYVAHTRARNEKSLATELTRLGVSNYLPLTRRTTRSPATQRLSHSQIPVFPGYLFFNGSEDDRYLALRTNRIAKILDVLNQDQLVAELRRIDFLLTQTDTFEVANRLAVGDWGRIVSGPLRGLEGVITWYAGGVRLWINVTILGQTVNTQVDAGLVERTDPPPTM
jgi:transcription antitermination factor NusG